MGRLRCPKFWHKVVCSGEEGNTKHRHRPALEIAALVCQRIPRGRDAIIEFDAGIRARTGVLSLHIYVYMWSSQETHPNQPQHTARSPLLLASETPRTLTIAPNI